MNKGPLSYSTRLLRKGALVEETYRIFAHWDLGLSLSDNLERIRETNPLGAKNQSWLREVTLTLSSRFAHGDSIESLVILAKAQYPLEHWRFFLLWHFGSTDGLFSRFVGDFLFKQRLEDIAAFDTDAVAPFVSEIDRERILGAPLTSYGRVRFARDLLRMAAAFGLITDQLRRRFTQITIPDDAFLYGLYTLHAEISSVSRAVESPRWRLFLLGSTDVERELLNLHQFRRLRYEQAGTIRELSLTYDTPSEFARSLIS
jgi:hypothetical protein